MSAAELGEPHVLFDNERDAPSPQQQPLMDVRSWRMLKSMSGQLHLVTFRDCDADRGVVRLTSAIVSIDLAERTVITSSGRQYVLVVPPEPGAFERQVLWAGAARLGLLGATDVSDWSWGQMRDD